MKILILYPNAVYVCVGGVAPLYVVWGPGAPLGYRDMSCEDYEDRNGQSLLEKAARQLASLLASPPIRGLAVLLPRGMRRAIVTVLWTAADVLRR